MTLDFLNNFQGESEGRVWGTWIDRTPGKVQYVPDTKYSVTLLSIYDHNSNHACFTWSLIKWGYISKSWLAFWLPLVIMAESTCRRGTAEKKPLLFFGKYYCSGVREWITWSIFRPSKPKESKLSMEMVESRRLTLLSSTCSIIQLQLSK